MNWPSVAAIGAMLFASGCGSSAPTFERVAVKGTVTVDNKPLSAGVIRFLPQGELVGQNVEAIVVEGAYSLDELSGPVSGLHRVEIEATDHLAFSLDDETAYARQIQANRSLPANPIPPQFNRRSTLSTNIPKEGNEQLNFALETRPKR